jgi:hypothetical protein
MNPIPLPTDDREQDVAQAGFPQESDRFAQDGFRSEFPDYRYDPLDEPFVPSAPVAAPVLVTPARIELEDLEDHWSWHDAALVGVERANPAGDVQYEVGCVDLYANTQTGDLGGNYLRLDSFTDIDAAAGLYHQLQQTIYDQHVPPFYIADFAARQSTTLAQKRGLDSPMWTACGSAEYSAYEQLRSTDPIDRENRPVQDFQNVMDRLAGGSDMPVQSNAPAESSQTGSTFQALHDIGLEAEGFDPEKDPPPFFDETTHTAYWIGVFQPDRHDSSHCVASILSLARDPGTGEVEARLAPCVPGDWDKAYQACEHLLDAVEKGGIERCFDTAEGMAFAADQRKLWEQERGVALESDAAHDLADYTHSTWEIDL